jgi:hypothetical protein
MQTNRDESFIPLAPSALASNERPDFRVTVLPQTGTAQSFQALGQSNSSHAASHAPGNEARVSLRREGDRVSVIEVHCACGRIVELDCVYESEPAPAPTAPPAAPAPAPGPAAPTMPESAAPVPPAAPSAAAIPVDALPAKPKSAPAKARGK